MVFVIHSRQWPVTGCQRHSRLHLLPIELFLFFMSWWMMQSHNSILEFAYPDQVWQHLVWVTVPWGEKEDSHAGCMLRPVRHEGSNIGQSEVLNCDAVVTQSSPDPIHNSPSGDMGLSPFTLHCGHSLDMNCSLEGLYLWRGMFYFFLFYCWPYYRWPPFLSFALLCSAPNSSPHLHPTVVCAHGLRIHVLWLILSPSLSCPLPPLTAVSLFHGSRPPVLFGSSVHSVH